MGTTGSRLWSPKEYDPWSTRSPPVQTPQTLRLRHVRAGGQPAGPAARPRRSIRLELLLVLGLVFAALISEPWLTLAGICVAYLLLLPVGVVAYGRVRRRRAAREGARKTGQAVVSQTPDGK